ncbi:MAG: hypothetical protein HFACDABA_03039 [Anaerolineales bacterium]|nr:hypothetical protein [Anaerolineales bacterium]
MNFKDVELLSAYLDGQTSPSDLSRLETRLASDPELAATLQALRESRGLIRQLPKRRAPRNFTLTYAMVGKKPPLPRSYPFFKFATGFAAFLFLFSFAVNRTSQLAASAPQAAYGIGGGGGDAAEAPMLESVPAEAQAPSEAEPTMEMVFDAATPEPAAGGDTARTANEPPAAKNPEAATAPAPFQIPPAWMIVFAAIALLGAASMFIVQRLAAQKWRGK